MSFQLSFCVSVNLFFPVLAQFPLDGLLRDLGLGNIKICREVPHLITVGQKYKDILQKELSASYCCPHRFFRDKIAIQSLLHTIDIENHFTNTDSSFSAVLLEFILIAFWRRTKNLSHHQLEKFLLLVTFFHFRIIFSMLHN